MTSNKDNAITASEEALIELRAGIENRLQFVSSLAIFFSVLAYTLAKAGGNQEIPSSLLSLGWSTPVAIYLVTYIFFKAQGKNLKKWSTQCLDGLLWAGIGSFILPMIIFGLLPTSKTPPHFVIFFYNQSLALIMLTPAIMFCFIVLALSTPLRHN